MMKTQPKFTQWLQESEELSREEQDRLLDMGLDQMEADEAWNKMVDEWYADPEVQAAEKVLRQKFDLYWAKYHRTAHEEEWEQMQNQMWEAQHDEIGLWGWLMFNQ